MSHKATDLRERFLSKIEKRDSSDCWEWKGGKFDSGYGVIRIKGKNQRAHRISYELFVGTIPDGMRVCHRCDNPACVNPTHLFIGTDSDNMQDMIQKKRGVFQKHPDRQPRGERNGTAKLTANQVAEIRRLRSQGVFQRIVAKMFGISSVHVGKIERGEKWKQSK